MLHFIRHHWVCFTMGVLFGWTLHYCPVFHNDVACACVNGFNDNCKCTDCTCDQKTICECE